MTCKYKDCISLSNIVISQNITDIEKDTFSGCDSLVSLHIKANNPESIDIAEESFEKGIFEKCTLFVPAGTRWKYRHHPVFGKFKNIEIDH